MLSGKWVHDGVRGRHVASAHYRCASSYHHRRAVRKPAAHRHRYACTSHHVASTAGLGRPPPVLTGLAPVPSTYAHPALCCRTPRCSVGWLWGCSTFTAPRPQLPLLLRLLRAAAVPLPPSTCTAPPLQLQLVLLVPPLELQLLPLLLQPVAAVPAAAPVATAAAAPALLPRQREPRSWSGPGPLSAVSVPFPPQLLLSHLHVHVRAQPLGLASGQLRIHWKDGRMAPAALQLAAPSHRRLQLLQQQRPLWRRSRRSCLGARSTSGTS